MHLSRTFLFAIGMLWSLAASAEFDHGNWDVLLKRHVVQLRDGQVTQVDYAGMRADRSRLNAYLQSLSDVSPAEFNRWERRERLAFLINAYNAWTLELVLQGAPDVASIRDLGSLFQSPWKKAFIPLLGRTVSLDDIEHGMIRPDDAYREPRIHFAVNCASIGCPALRREAYVAARLDAQLADATSKFLADRQRNRFRDGELQVSSIFKWYREDFEKGWGGHRNLAEFFVAHSASLGLTAPQAVALERGDIDIEFLDYDWNLNRRP